MGHREPLDRCRDLDIESYAVWPAFHEQKLGSWSLRFGGGAYGRSNSVQPHGDPGVELREAISFCERAYRAEGLPCLFRIPELGDWIGFDEYLASLGYEHYNETEVQVAPLEGATMSDLVALSSDPDTSWLEAYLAESGRDADPNSPAARLMRLVPPPRRFGRIVHGRETVAVGLGAIYNAKVWIFGMGTREPWRRRGYATLIAGSLMAWAHSEGATRAALQVTPENRAAISVYEKLRFRSAYAYHYRRQVIN